MSTRVPVSLAVRTAFAFWPVAWRRCWAALLLAAALTGLFAVMGRDGSALARVAVGVGVLAAGVMARGGLYRTALARLGRADLKAGPAGLQWAAAEWRLVGTVILVGVLLILALALVLVVFLGVSLGLASAGQGFAISDPNTWRPSFTGRARVLHLALAAVCAGALVWIALRLALAQAATVARRKVQVLSAWPLTGGNVLGLLVGTVAVSLPALIALGAGAIALDAVHAAHPLRVLRLGYALAAVLLQLPLGVGLTTYFYDRVSPPSAESPA
ncbi:MAG: hypothetical protein ACHP84_17650 [Caulobacterales bacterium]